MSKIAAFGDPALRSRVPKIHLRVGLGSVRCIVYRGRYFQVLIVEGTLYLGAFCEYY